MAIRESEVAARTCGVNTYWCKVTAFAVSAGIVGVAGWLGAQRFAAVLRAPHIALVLAAAHHMAHGVEPSVFEDEQHDRRRQTGEDAEREAPADDDHEDEQDDQVLAESDPPRAEDQPLTDQ